MIARDTVIDKIKLEGFNYYTENEKEISFVKKHLTFVINKRPISYRDNCLYSLYKYYYIVINTNSLEDVIQALKDFYK